MIKNYITPALENEVSDAIKDTESDVIEREVYSVFKPIYYDRRGSTGGGLGSTDNMYAESFVNGNTVSLSVENQTPPNDNYKHRKFSQYSVAESVETGKGYDYFPNGEMESRPFTQKTIEELKRNKQHIKALKKSLERRGLKIK